MCIIHTILSNVKGKVNYLLGIFEANVKLTGRQHCGRKPSANDNIYAENNLSKKTPLLAVGCSFLLYDLGAALLGQP